jgi:WD40 repeat protein
MSLEKNPNAALKAQTFWSIAKLGHLLIALIPLWANAGIGPQLPERVRVEEVDVLQTDFFLSKFPAGSLKAFDLSPDGKTVAVEFETWEPDGMRSIWITLWSLEPQRLERTIRLEGPDREVGRNPQYSYQVQYSLQDNLLFVLTGPRLLALSLPTLQPAYALEARVPYELIGKQLFIYRFALASDSKWLAILYLYHSGSSRSFEIRLLDSEKGTTVNRWVKPGRASNIAISPDGKRIALPVNPVVTGLRVPSNGKNVFVFDATSGEALQSFNTDYTAACAEFVSNGQQLLTVADNHGSPEHYSADTLKLWDVGSGTLLRELRYSDYGIRGTLGLAGNGRMVIVVTEWADPRDIRHDRDIIRGFARFLLWDLSSASPTFTSPGLFEGAQWAPGEHRFSAGVTRDGRRFAVGKHHILVYQVTSTRP